MEAKPSIHTSVFICEHIFNKEDIIKYVVKEDNEFQFLCGKDHEIDELPRVVGLGHIIDYDESIKDILDIEDGYEAERNDENGNWTIRKLSD
ncbi:MAG: hypothetical protein RLN81_02250 [Balneolaceae bacterium]